MKVVSYLTDENNNKKAVVIDFDVKERRDDELADLIDGIIAESRKNDEEIHLVKVKDKLKKADELK